MTKYLCIRCRNVITIVENIGVKPEFTGLQDQSCPYCKNKMEKLKSEKNE